METLSVYKARTIFKHKTLMTQFVKLNFKGVKNKNKLRVGNVMNVLSLTQKDTCCGATATDNTAKTLTWKKRKN